MKTKRIITLTLTIVIFGLICVYSSSHIWALYKYDDSFYYIKRQAIFACIGVIAMFVTSRIDYHLYKKYYKQIIGVCFLLLILVLIPGLGVVRGGSRSWFNFGIFALQPSELFKIGMIIFAAVFIEKNYYQMKKLRYSLKLLMVMGLGISFDYVATRFWEWDCYGMQYCCNDYCFTFSLYLFCVFRCIRGSRDCFNDFICSLSYGENSFFS